jgi:hypothetical protein
VDGIHLRPPSNSFLRLKMKNLVRCKMAESLECFLAFVTTGQKCMHCDAHARYPSTCSKSQCSFRSPIVHDAQCVEVKEDDNS